MVLSVEGLLHGAGLWWEGRRTSWGKHSKLFFSNYWKAQVAVSIKFSLIEPEMWLVELVNEMRLRGLQRHGQMGLMGLMTFEL